MAKGFWPYNNKAFTLAEVLITLGIIGVVAAMTIPTLISVNNQRAWDTASNVFVGKLGKSLSVMNTQNALGGWPTTEAFVSELQKHMKINKVCANPTDCFESEITAGSEDEIIDMTKITRSKNLYSTANPDWETNVMGIQFANGVSALLAYNPKCKNTPFSNERGKSAVRVTSDADDAHSNNGKKSSIGLETTCISILYDVNGYGKPNKYSTGVKSDLRGINVSLNVKSCTQLGSYCFAYFGTTYSPVDCSTANSESSDYTTYCGPTPSGFTNDYWAGAKKKCADEGLTLPSLAKLLSFYNDNKSTLGQEGGVPIPPVGFYMIWSSEEGSGMARQYTAGVRYYDSFDGDQVANLDKNFQMKLLCIE